jgi:putative endonuclease
MSNFDLNNYVYITTNPRRTVFYKGVTNDLQRRVNEHQSNKGDNSTFAGKYFCYELVYYEVYNNIVQAINREKEIKNSSKNDKMDLIRKSNPYLKKIEMF